MGTCLKSPKILRDPGSEFLGSKVDLGSFSKNFTYEINKTDRHVLEGFRRHMYCSIYKRGIAATIARIWIPNLGHLGSVDMSAKDTKNRILPTKQS